MRFMMKPTLEKILPILQDLKPYLYGSTEPVLQKC